MITAGGGAGREGERETVEEWREVKGVLRREEEFKTGGSGGAEGTPAA